MTMDLAASILAATATPVPSDARLEALNLLPILQRKARRQSQLYSGAPQGQAL